MENWAAGTISNSVLMNNYCFDAHNNISRGVEDSVKSMSNTGLQKLDTLRVLHIACIMEELTITRHQFKSDSISGSDLYGWVLEYPAS